MKICILNNIEIHIAKDGIVNAYKCSPSGEPTDWLRSKDSAETIDIYWCENCGFSTRREDYNIREHLGKMHNFIDPFPVV